MQILEFDCDPWRDQPFVETPYLSDVHIPVDDIDAYSVNPDHRWVYDKFRVTQSQGIECGFHDTPPVGYPIFCKPITNLRGLGSGRGGRVLRDERAFREHCEPGDFWMPVLAGESVSSDLAVIDGQSVWVRHTLGVGAGQSWDHWIVEERSRPRLERYCQQWIAEHLAGYTGMVNIETTGGRITGVHLRFAEQWSDLYGRKWLDALVRLYRSRTWDLVDAARAVGYSVVLFGDSAREFSKPSLALLAQCRRHIGVSRVFLGAEEADGSPGSHNRVGVRLAVVNAFNLEVGYAVRADLAKGFGIATPQP